jgi:hypothetical protein
MRLLVTRIAILFTLVAFLVTTSGWVLHRHYCPESEQQVFSLLEVSQCKVPIHELPAACCEKPAAQPQLPLDAAACGTEDGCCQDALIFLELASPFALPDGSFGTAANAPLLLAVMRPSASLWQVMPEAVLPRHPLPPPPLRCLDRLNALQVYRT